MKPGKEQLMAVENLPLREKRVLYNSVEAAKACNMGVSTLRKYAVDLEAAMTLGKVDAAEGTRLIEVSHRGWRLYSEEALLIFKEMRAEVGLGRSRIDSAMMALKIDNTSATKSRSILMEEIHKLKLALSELKKDVEELQKLHGQT